MKPMLVVGLIGILTAAVPPCKRQPQEATLPAAGASPKETLIAATTQLGEKANYSWSALIREADGGSGPLGPLGPIEGKADKAGVTYLRFSIGDILIEVYRDGPKGAVQLLMGGGGIHTTRSRRWAARPPPSCVTCEATRLRPPSP